MGNRLLIGQIALEMGLLRKEQLGEGLSMQAGQARPRPIGELLAENGFLRREQIEVLLAEQQRRLNESVAYAVATKAEASFGRLVVKLGLAAEEHVNEALRAQQDFAERGTRKRLGELLVEAGRLSSEAVLTVLAKQGKTIRACTFCGAHYNVLLEVASAFACRRCGMTMKDTLASIGVEETSFLMPAVRAPVPDAPPAAATATPPQPPPAPSSALSLYLMISVLLAGVGAILLLLLKG